LVDKYWTDYLHKDLLIESLTHTAVFIIVKRHLYINNLPSGLFARKSKKNSVCHGVNMPNKCSK